MFDTKPTRRDWLVFLFMLILVPLAGEPKIHPFTGDFANFRVSFGSPVFLLFLLWLRPFPRLFTGTCAGITVMLFRTALDVCLYGQPLGASFALHVPTFFYYFGYALFFALPQLTHKSIYAQALEIAFWAIIAEVFASVAELAAMNAIAYQESYQLTLGMLGRLLLIAVFRCFFILSFFFLFQLYNTEVRLTRKTKEQHRLSLLISSLYEEAFELRCALRSAEDVTHDCYQIYDAVKALAHTPQQQAIAQVLTPIYESQFSDASFGFRPGRGAHDALKACQKYANEGYVYVVDMDLEKFFDTVCQSKLIEVLSRSIKDGKVISLIHRYLNAGVIQRGMFEKSEQGVPQGGPLSPLLSNVMLNELDKELERRGHKFVRYADDCMILCKSRRSAERTLTNIIPFIEKKLFLKVNREKTSVAHISKVKYLGYGFYRYKGECRFKVHKKSLAKMKNRLRAITNRSKAISNEDRPLMLKQFVKGWVNYFKLADMKKLLKQVDEWLRRRIRAVYWKQWKKVKTRYRMIKQYNLPEWKVHELANCRKGIWRAALMLNQILTNKEIARQGYITMTSYYEQVCEN